MRRLRDRRPAPFFRGSELPRLLALVVMLGVLLLLMNRARDPNTWRWLAPAEPERQTAAAADVTKGKPAASETEPVVPGPSDLDPAERDAAAEELAAVSDKTPLGKEEMPAYWRLMAWELHQSTDGLMKRADDKVTFNDLWQQPGKWRGKLIRLPVHLQRTLTVHDVAQNGLGLKTIYEVSGWNSQSQPYSYLMIVPRLPPGMPQGDILEEATFVGYFLKLQPYEDREGKTRAAPLLIGRLIWHPAADNPLARRDEWTWIVYVAGALLLLAVLRWGLTFMGRTNRPTTILPPAADEQTVESWLEGKASPPLDNMGPEVPGFDFDAEGPESK